MADAGVFFPIEELLPPALLVFGFSSERSETESSHGLVV